MTNFIIVICSLAILWFVYWRGFVSGVKYNVKVQFSEFLVNFPVNIEVTCINGISYANMMMTSEFLGQAVTHEILVDMMLDKFPNQQVVITRVEDETV